MRKFLLFLLLLLPSFVLLIQKGYFSMHDDLQSMRQYQLDKCFMDKQIPCRWVSDMGYGYGYPLFNFYPPFPYYLGQIFRSLGIAYIDVVKIVGILGFLTAAGFMYLLGRELWGDWGGIVSSLVYTYAPYHAVDYYVRGAVNEFWAMAFYPAAFWTILRLIKSRHIAWIPAVSLSVAGIMLSHNPMLMIFAPVLILWSVYWLFKTRNFISFIHLVFAAFWAAGLAAFFTLPVVFEQQYAHVETLVIGYFNYLAHYLDLRQLFLNINWGYGSSILGPADTMSFAIGYLQWLLPLFVFLGALFSRSLSRHRSLIVLFSAVFLGAVFMTHSKSTFIWQAIKPLEFLQFPWRFLTLAVFVSALLSGAATLLIRHRLFYVILVVFLVATTGQFFRPDKWYPDMTDSQKFSGTSWQLLVTSGIFDYLPIYAPMPPADPAGSDLGFLEGSGSFIRETKLSQLQKYTLTVETVPAVVQLQTYYFPGWRVWINDQEVSLNPYADKTLGRIQFSIDTPGQYQIEARFTNTFIRSLGNTISLISWLGMVGIIGIWIRRSMISKLARSKPALSPA